MGGLPAAGGGGRKVGRWVWWRRHLIRCATLTSSGLCGDVDGFASLSYAVNQCQASELSSTDTIGKLGNTKIC